MQFMHAKDHDSDTTNDKQPYALHHRPKLGQRDAIQQNPCNQTTERELTKHVVL